MAVTYFPFNSIVVDGVPDRSANAETLAAYLAGFFGNGVLMQEDTSLQVAPSGGMNVQIRAGVGNINGKTIINDAAEIVTLAASNASLARIDRVVFRLDERNRLMEFDVLTGTPASSPKPPTLTQTAAIYELCLAEIRIPAGATIIAANYITDTRLNPSLCGVSSVAPHMQDVKYGGTGAATIEDALANFGLAPEVYRGSEAEKSMSPIIGDSTNFTEWTYTVKHIPALGVVFFRGYAYTKEVLEANENYVVFTIDDPKLMTPNSTALTVFNGGNACGDARVLGSNGEITLKFPAAKSAKIGIFIAGFWFTS